MAIDVFVTYSPMDRLAATSLIRVLGTRGLTSWQPGVDLPMDEPNADRMEKLSGARAVAVLLSKTTNQFKRMKIELEDATQRKIPVVFVNLANASVPPDLLAAAAGAKLLQANRPPTDAQLDMIVDILVLELGDQAEHAVEFDALIEPEDTEPDFALEPALDPPPAPEISPANQNADVLDLAGDVDRAISERSGFGTGRLTLSETAKHQVGSEKTRAITPPKDESLEAVVDELDLAEDDLAIDISDIKPTSQQSVATAPTQVIDAPSPKTLKQGISEPAEAKAVSKPAENTSTPTLAMPDMGDTLLGKIKKNAVLIGIGTGVAIGVVVGGAFVLHMIWGDSNTANSTGTKAVAVPTPVTPNPGDAATTTKPSGSTEVSAPHPVPDPAPAPMDPAAMARVVLPKPSHLGWHEHDDAVVDNPDVVIDKSAANIFSAPGNNVAPGTKGSAPHSPSQTPPGRIPQVAIATHDVPALNPSSEGGSVAPTAGSKGVLAARVFSDDTGNRSRMLALMIRKPGEKVAGVATIAPPSRSDTAASARAKTDPDNQAYRQDVTDFAHTIADQIAVDAKALDEIKDQVKEEQADIQRQVDRTTADVASQTARINAQILDVMQSAGAHPGNLDPWIARASLEREKGDLDGARTDINHVLKINPKEPTALKEQGRILDLFNDLKGAIQSMDMAVQMLPRDDEVAALRGMILLRAGREANAERDFKASLQINPNQSLADIGLGDLAYRHGDWNGALGFYKTATELNPRSFDARMGQGRALLKLRSPLKSLSGFNEALDIRVDAEPFARRAEAYCEMVNYGRALANANASVTADPRLWIGHVAVAKVLSAMGRNESAIKHLYWAGGLNPGSATPVAVRGRVYLEMGDWDQAGIEFASAINADPNCLEAILGQARLARCRGNFDEAMAWANRALQVDPGCTDAYVIRSHVLRETNDLSGSNEQALEVLKVLPNDPGSLLSLGVTSLIGNSPNDADAYAVKAIQAAPNLPQGYALRTIISIDQGNLERARTFSDEMIKLAPGLSQTSYIQGLADLAWCRYQSALDASNRALLLNSRNQGAMVLKARALIDLDQPRNAVKIATEVLNWNENLVAAYVVRGNAYQAAGDRRRAQNDYQKARELDPQLDIDNVKLYAFDGF